MITIASHSGSFHADDVFSLAVLCELYPDSRVVRTRDPQVIAAADFAVDVGDHWDPARGRFDHHQRGFSGRRPGGAAYASAGLVWLTHGRAFIDLLVPGLSEERQLQIHDRVDEQLVTFIDMTDTGEGNAAPGAYGLSALVDYYNLTRTEELQCSDAAAAAALRLERFTQVTSVVRDMTARLIAHIAVELSDEAVVLAAERLDNGRILVLPASGLGWINVVCREMPEVALVVYPDSTDEHYHLRTVPVEPESFKARLDLPSLWSGLRGQHLAQACGVPDAVFCHTACFIAGAGSLEGALDMAEAALALAPVTP